MVGSIVNAVIGSKASKKAAKWEAAAAGEASRQEQAQYDLSREDLLANQEQTRADYLPFMQTGQGANAELARRMGVGGDAGSEGYGSLTKPFTMADYEEDPGYAFRLEEGQKALGRFQAGKGKYFSGGAMKGAIDYGQKSASQEYSSAYDRYRQNQADFFSRLTGTSNAGQNAAGGISGAAGRTQGTLANVGQGKQSAVSENTIGAGNAMAGGIMGSANAWATGINQAGEKGAEMAGYITGLNPTGG